MCLIVEGIPHFLIRVSYNHGNTVMLLKISLSWQFHAMHVRENIKIWSANILSFTVWLLVLSRKFTIVSSELNEYKAKSRHVPRAL